MSNHIIRNDRVRRISVLVVFIFVFTFTVTSCKSNTVSSESIKAFNKSEELLYQYKLEDAKANLKEILKKDPNYADANRKMAFIEYYYYQNYDEALKYIQKALESQPKGAENYQVLGDIYFADCKYKNAIESYKNALNLDSENMDVYYSVAQIYLRLGDSKEARKVLEAANSFNPFDVKINASLHLQCIKDGEYDKAYAVWKNGNVSDKESLGYFGKWNELYKAAMESRTDNRHMKLGNMYAELLLYDEAALELNRALKDDPDNNAIGNKLYEINLFIKFRDELKECWNSYYQRRIINGPGEEYLLKGKVEKIYKQMLVLFPDMEYNSLDFNNWASYTLNNEIQKKFNVIINCWSIDGLMDCYFGYVVGKSNEEISQWGKKTDIRVTLSKNAVINIFLDWYLNTNGLGGWSSTILDENNEKRVENKIMLDSKYKLAYDYWKKAINTEKRSELLDEAEKSDKDLLERPSLEVFYSSLLKQQFEFKAMDELINEAKTKFNTEEEIKSYVINYLVYEVFVPLTYLHEGQHAIDNKYDNFDSWELEYRAMMSEPVYGQMQLLDITAQLQQDIGNESTSYGKAQTKIFTDIVNHINNHKADYPVIDTNKNIMMQLSKLSANDLKELSKNIFEQEYPGEKYE